MLCCVLYVYYDAYVLLILFLLLIIKLINFYYFLFFTPLLLLLLFSYVAILCCYILAALFFWARVWISNLYDFSFVVWNNWIDLNLSSVYLIGCFGSSVYLSIRPWCAEMWSLAINQMNMRIAYWKWKRHKKPDGRMISFRFPFLCRSHSHVECFFGFPGTLQSTFSRRCKWWMEVVCGWLRMGDERKLAITDCISTHLHACHFCCPFALAIAKNSVFEKFLSSLIQTDIY